jgi:hypothetical protein
MKEEAILHIHLHKSKYGYHVIIDQDGQLTAEGMTTLSEAFSFLEETVRKSLV